MTIEWQTGSRRIWYLGLFLNLCGSVGAITKVPHSMTKSRNFVIRSVESLRTNFLLMRIISILASLLPQFIKRTGPREGHTKKVTQKRCRGPRVTELGALCMLFLI